MEQTPALSVADQLRAEAAASAIRRAEHDQVQLGRAEELLETARASIEALAALAPDIVTPFVQAHLNALAADHGRAVEAVKTARDAVAKVLKDEG